MEDSMDCVSRGYLEYLSHHRSDRGFLFEHVFEDLEVVNHENAHIGVVCVDHKDVAAELLGRQEVHLGVLSLEKPTDRTLRYFLTKGDGSVWSLISMLCASVNRRPRSIFELVSTDFDVWASSLSSSEWADFKLIFLEASSFLSSDILLKL